MVLKRAGPEIQDDAGIEAFSSDEDCLSRFGLPGPEWSLGMRMSVLPLRIKTDAGDNDAEVF